MRALLAFAVLGLALASACTPPPSACCVLTPVARDVEYRGRIPSPDGGTALEVRVTMAPNGNTVVTFIGEGHEIAEGFTAAAAVGP